MDKRGFTLTEVLAVIVIISILTLITIPSVAAINKSINKRLLNQKKDYIITAAELYATDHPDIFNTSNKNTIYVYQLLEYGYIKADDKYGNNSCSANGIDSNTILSEEQKNEEKAKLNELIAKGCIYNPVTKNLMNGSVIVLTKRSGGVFGEITIVENCINGGDSCEKQEDESSNSIHNDYSSGNKILDTVCAAINPNSDGEFKLKCKSSVDSKEYTICNENKNNLESYKKTDEGITLSGNPEFCVIVSSDDNDANNYLEYSNGDENGEMFRILGLYDINGDARLSVKIVTSENVGK